MIFKLLSLIYFLLLWYYFATNLQWYAYKLNRLLFKSAKPQWHFIYFLAPFAIFAFLATSSFGMEIWLAFSGLYIISMAIWYKKLDKPLVFTGRIKRLLLIYVAIILPPLFLFKLNGLPTMLIISLIVAYFASASIEKRFAKIYENLAKDKLTKVPTVVAITASYGKTSIKNILATILSTQYKVYATPKSVNTKNGIMKDINDNLPSKIDIYIIEAGAREKGDIQEIVEITNPQYAVIGKIGSAHLEYFGNLTNTKNTKREILLSNRLKQAFIHESASNSDDTTIFSENNIQNLSADLSGVSFEYNGVFYFAPLLGKFQAINILAAILVAQELGMKDEQIASSLLKMQAVEHRLQRIDAGGKIIIDDSFNGNLDGISEGIRLCSLHNGIKVIVTPGIIESGDEVNEELAKLINDVFDLVIITGTKNVKLLDSLITKPKKIILSDKTKLTQTLADETSAGSIIYFANDAPSFI